MNLASKTTLLLTAIVTTVIVAVSIFLLQYQEQSLKHTILEGLDGQATIAAHGIESFVEEGVSGAGAISATLPVKALLAGRLGEVEAHLQRMLKTFPKFQNGIFILDREGRFLADYPSHPELRGQSFAFREYYRRTIQEGRGIVGAPYKSRRTGLPVLTFTAPVRDAKGRIVAVLACSADLLARESLGGYWKQKFGTTGYLYVFDRSRLLILHPDNNRLLTQVEAGKNRILEAALSGFEGGGETVNSMGVPMLLSVRQIPKAGWIVAVQVTREEAYAPVAQSRERIMLISGIALLPAILLGAVAIRRITRPLQQLERVASQISVALEEAETKETYDPAQSALDDLTTIRSRDEIGLLASSFFRLATKLNLTLGSLQRSARDWERTFNSVNEAVVTLDMESRIMRMNHAAEAMFRTSRQKIQGHYAYQVLFDVALPPLDWPDFARLSEHQRVRWSQHLEKPPRIMEFTITPVTVAGNVVGAVLVISDITERVESEDHIREMAFYDQLTGLPNRFLLQDRIRQAIASAERSGKKAGIMFLDLDHFKIINDLCGHDVGDEVLKQEAGRISKCLRKNDTLSRIGGDEFVIVLQEIDNLREAATIAERIIGEQASPCSIQGHALTISSSIGIAIFPEDGVDGETLLKNADQAMYRAKGRGRGTYQFVQHKTGNSDESATRE